MRKILLSLILFLSSFLSSPAFAQTPIDHVRVYRFDDDGIPPNQWTTIDFDTEVYDPNGNFDASVYTAPYDGYFLFCTNLDFDITSWVYWNVLHLGLRVNGSNYTRLSKVTGMDGPTSLAVSISGCGVLLLSAGDEVEVIVYQITSGNLYTIEGEDSMWLVVSELPYRYATPMPTETPIPTNTPNATIVALVTAIANLTPTSTITPGSQIYLPYVVTDTLSSGNTWAFARSVTAGEVAIGVVGLCLLIAAMFKGMTSIL